MSSTLLETTQCLCLASRRASRAITREFDRALRPEGLRATQFTLLAILALKGPQPIGALAELIGLDRTTLSRNIGVAEARSLVTVRPGNDARSHIVSITAEGRRTLGRAFKVWRKTQSALAKKIGTGAAASLTQLGRESRSGFMQV